jgi:redox-sensitive bicupin YhaK (pirin superfamily)
MITVRPAPTRGHTELGWLDSRHTFSFGEYYDPQAMGFRVLRVINEDRVAPKGGFGTHPHRDMEILTYVLEGVLKHQDSMGSHGLIKPGEIQRMSAGTGVTHSEMNGSTEAPVHFLQIWILPSRGGLAPGYEQHALPAADSNHPLQLIASAPGRGGAVTLNQEVALWRGLLDAKQEASLPLAPSRHAWVQVTRGGLTVNGIALKAGDGAAVSEENKLDLRGSAPAEFLIFDLP